MGCGERRQNETVHVVFICGTAPSRQVCPVSDKFRRFTEPSGPLILKEKQENQRMRKAMVGAILLAMFSACSKGDPNQAASDIAAGLAGGTGKSLSNSVALTAPAEPVSDSVGSLINQQVEGIAWLTKFKLASGVPRPGQMGEDLTLNSSICSTGTSQFCTSSCNGSDTTFTVSCTLPDSSSYTCNGTQYSFSSASFSV